MHRVKQGDFVRPDLTAWSARLREVLAEDPRPTVLVAHSLGALLVAHTRPAVTGALLVAPPDLDHQPFAELASFAPLPRARLDFPCIVVASQNDPYATFERTRQLAQAWGARFVDAGFVGHLNSESNLGTWPAGRAWLRELCALAPFELDSRLAKDTHLVARGPLSEVLLMDDERYPWLILVPRRSAVTELFELTDADAATLSRESALVTVTLARQFQPDKVNVGALGNVVRQLHVHHVGRTLGDPAWPGPVWGHSPRRPRTAAARAQWVERLFSDATFSAQFERV